ncbi:hypothetical protein WDW86_17535 [Bdellovibrionota bacterium FG-2]
MIRNSKGVMHVPMALAVTALMFLAFGVWGALRTHRLRVETQLRMDRCVKQKAIELRDLLGLIAKTNDMIWTLRMGKVPLTAIGFGDMDELGMQGLVIYQDLLTAAWEFERKKWWLSRGCDRSGDKAVDLPELKTWRDQDDLLGPQKLQWQGPWPEEFYIELRHAHVRSTVRVFQREAEYDEDDPANWRAEWSTAKKVESSYKGDKMGKSSSNPFSGWF